MIKKSYALWTSEEISKLHELYPAATRSDLLKEFGRSMDSISHKARKLGLLRTNRWSDDQLAILRENYCTTSAREISKLIDRDVDAIYRKAIRLRMRKTDRTSDKTPASATAWKPHEDQFLKESRGIMPAAVIARQLNRSQQAVYMRSVRIGLVKAHARTGGGIAAKPLGSERIHRGILERKVSNSGNKQKDWKRVDVIEWEAINGPVPKGMVLVKAFGMPRTIENLILKSADEIPVIRAQLNATADMKKLFNLKARLGAAIAKIEKLNAPIETPGKTTPRSRPIIWTPQEIEYLRKNHESMTAKEIGEKLQLSMFVVHKKRRELGLARLHRQWSKEDEANLAKLYRTTSNKDLSKIFDRSCSVICNKAWQLGLSSREVRARCEE